MFIDSIIIAYLLTPLLEVYPGIGWANRRLNLQFALVTIVEYNTVSRYIIATYVHRKGIVAYAHKLSHRTRDSSTFPVRLE